MAKLILDKNLETEKVFEIDNVFERALDNLLNCVKTVHFNEGEEVPVIPVVDTPFFTTVEVEADGESIPLICRYNKIVNLNTQYYDVENIYSYNIDLTFEVQ